MLAGGKRSTLGGELSEGYYVQPTVLEGNNRKGAHPGEHLLVAVPGCGKALACQDPIKLIDNGGNMKIFMRIHAADDTTARDLLITSHTGLSWLDRC